MKTALLENRDALDRLVLLSVDAYHELGKLGKISEKTELLEGIIVEKMPKDPIHSSIVGSLYERILRILPGIFSIRQENPITIDKSEPEPDIAIVEKEPGNYRIFHPLFAHFIIEVANTSLSLDRNKALIYSKGNIPEYWIINLLTNEIEVYRNPSSTGYKSLQVFSKDETISPLILPTWSFCLQDYLQ